MIGTLARTTAGALAIGALALVGAGSAAAATTEPAQAPAQASAAQPWRGDFCDAWNNRWDNRCDHTNTWRWEGQRWDGHRWDGGHWQHYRYNGGAHRWDRR